MKRTRALRVGAVLAGLVVLQGAAVLVYRAVDRARRAPSPSFRGERMTGSAETELPELEVERGNGSTFDVAASRGKLVLVHFWATWCPPCRDELPGLLALGARLAASGRFQLYAVSVDRDWSVVRDFFPESVPETVVRARDPGAYRRYGVGALPDSYLVAPDGRLIERYAGARDWRSPAAEAHLASMIEALP